MTTVTGDYAINYVPLSNADPFIDSNLTALDGTLAYKILSNVLRPSTGGGGPFAQMRFRYNGAMSSTATLRAKFEIGNAGGGDVIQAMLLQPTGAGYTLDINQTSFNIKTIDATGAEGGLNNGTAASATLGDDVMLELVQSTHTLNAYCNGTLVVTTTDSTYTTGLAFALGFLATNSSASTVRSFAGDGIVAAGPSPGAGALNLAGNIPGLVRGSVITPKVARQMLRLIGNRWRQFKQFTVPHGDSPDWRHC